MTLQPVGSVNANTNINTNFKPAAHLNEKPKEDVKHYDDGEKQIYAALSGLAALSLAGIGIAAMLKKGNAAPPKNPSNTIEGVQNTVNNIAKTSAKTRSKAKMPGQKDVSKTLHKKSKQVAGNIKPAVNKNSIDNVNKNNNPVSKKDLAIIKKKQAEARANLLKKNDTIQQTLANANKSIISSVGDIRNAGQGIKSATNMQVLDKKATEAQNAAQNIANRAQEMKNIAKEIPTHKNIKRAQTAHNKAIRAKLDAGKVQEKINEKKTQFALDAAKKEQNIQKMIESTTPERLLEGQKKMEENTIKTSAKAVQRSAKRTMNRPGYQKALKQFQNHSSEKLQNIINSSKASNIEKTVAQDLLTAGKI